MLYTVKSAVGHELFSLLIVVLLAEHKLGEKSVFSLVYKIWIQKKLLCFWDGYNWVMSELVA